MLSPIPDGQMSMINQSERRYYPRGGDVNWVRFIPWLFATFVVSVVLACVLNLAIRVGFYLIIIIPMLAGLALAGMLFLAVQQGHCRNRLVAGICGVLMGTTLYLGYFYVGLISSIGIENISHVELLPRYIQFRMNSDRVRDSSESDVTVYRNKGQKNNSSDEEAVSGGDLSPIRTIGNWCLFAIEFGLILFLACGFAMGRAKKAYCERCQKWMEQELTTFQSEMGGTFLDAFGKGQLSVITNSRKVPILQQMPYTGVAIDYCSGAINGRSQCPVYLSIKDIKIANVFGNGQTAKFDAAQGKLILDRAELIGNEINGLANLFPVLGSIAHQGPIAQLANIPNPTDSTIPASTFQPSASAEVKPVFPGYEGKILTRKNIIMGNVVSFASLGAFFGGIAAVIGGIFLLLPDESTAAPQTVSATRMGLGILIIVLGAPMAVFFGYVGLRNPGVLGNRRYLALTRRSFKSRPERWMDFNHPEAFFVEVVPRKNWGRMMLETAEDIGFVRIDHGRREILFEGDRECYRIPADAIISCDVEKIVVGSDESKSVVHYMTVIRAYKGTTIWETSFAQRWITWSVNNDKRWARANEIKQGILNLTAPVAKPV
jgi:hypothetical protein